MKKRLPLQIVLTIVLAFGLFGFTNYTLKSNTSSTNTEVNVTEEHSTTDPSVVYMTSEISSESLMKMYEALGRELKGKVAVKIHSGEPGGNNFVKPELMKELVQSLNGTIVECNTAYGGGRTSAAMHKQVLEDHGFTAIAPIDIMDEDGSMSLPVEHGKHLQEDFVGSHFANYDSYVILSHFKGHAMGGFGGALKNMAIGIASAEGKMWVHTAGGTKKTGNFFPAMRTPQDDFLESMAEAAGAVMNYMDDKVVYINVMQNLSVDCDCMAHPKDPSMKDIGILASLDPVALDQACVDLVYKAADGEDLIKRMEKKHGIHTLEHAAALGIGNRTYKIQNIAN